MNTVGVEAFGGSRDKLPLLAVRDLCKFFPVYNQGVIRRKIGDVKAVNKVSFDLYPHETLGLVGESGCGKSTTVRTILRALEFTGGQAFFNHHADQYVELGTLGNRDLVELRQIKCKDFRIGLFPPVSIFCKRHKVVFRRIFGVFQHNSAVGFIIKSLIVEIAAAVFYAGKMFLIPRFIAESEKLHPPCNK